MGTGFGRAQFWLLVVILAFTALLAIGSSSGGSQSTAASAKGASAKASTHPEMPLAYFGQQYSRITESPHRKEKDARRSGFLRRELRDPGRPGAPRVVESELVIDTLGGHEPLPFATSTAVVIGTIESGSGFVASNNRTAYSEYTILVHRVLMQDAVLRIEPSN